MSIFKETKFRAQCVRCGVPFPAGKGGVCRECRDILCDAHLHGSTFRKLLRAVTGAPPVCPRCEQRATGAR